MTQLSTEGIANTNFRRALLAAQRVIGNDELVDVLQKANLSRFNNNIPQDDLSLAVTFEEYSRFNQEIEEKYRRGGAAVLKRIGQEMFWVAQKEKSTLLDVAGVTLKLLSSSQRIGFILSSIASAVQNTNPGVDAQVEESHANIAYIERNCAICQNRSSDQPICYLHLGELSAAINWIAGKSYKLRETQCIAKGDNQCRFEIAE